MSGRGFIAPEPKGKCAFCAAVKELRPYGPNGERICFDCGMKDEATTLEQLGRRVFGVEPQKKS